MSSRGLDVCWVTNAQLFRNRAGSKPSSLEAQLMQFCVHLPHVCTCILAGNVHERTQLIGTLADEHWRTTELSTLLSRNENSRYPQELEKQNSPLPNTFRLVSGKFVIDDTGSKGQKMVLKFRLLEEENVRFVFVKAAAGATSVCSSVLFTPQCLLTLLRLLTK